MTEIAAVHVLEHLGQQTDVFLAIIKELHRILVPGGMIEIKVPHPRSNGYWGDPTHVRPISPHHQNDADVAVVGAPRSGPGVSG